MIYAIISIIILILVLILLSFLLIPFKLSLYLTRQGNETEGKFTLRFLGITLISRKIPEDKTDEKEKKEEKAEKREKFSLERILKILKLFKESLPYIYSLLTSVYKAVTIEKFSLNMTLGMESPADTALFTGYIWSFTYPLNAITRLDVNINPDFQRKVLEGNFQVNVSLKLKGIVIEAIKAYAKKPVRELIKEVRQ
ncbi:MAG: hypothetical protein PWQ15_594 [Methanobacterium sp.]|nr:hypothetical protein [Methanobacterium sp.]CDG64807.1 hypothetical protein MBMB1_0703 [Methanobacterium sp. MB1]